MLGDHINPDGEFQSDKYDWSKPGFVPLKLTDPMAQPVLWRYAEVRESVDKDFAADLRMCLLAHGYLPTDLESSVLAALVAALEAMDAHINDIRRVLDIAPLDGSPGAVASKMAQAALALVKGE